MHLDLSPRTTEVLTFERCADDLVVVNLHSISTMLHVHDVQRSSSGFCTGLVQHLWIDTFRRGMEGGSATPRITLNLTVLPAFVSSYMTSTPSTSSSPKIPSSPCNPVFGRATVFHGKSSRWSFAFFLGSDKIDARLLTPDLVNKSE